MTSIWGTFTGNIVGTVYFLFFQLTGFLLACLFLSKKDFCTRLLCGSVLGSVLLHWIPALFAFLFRFSITAHLAAALACGGFTLFLFLKSPRLIWALPSVSDGKRLLKKHSGFFLFSLFTFVIFCILLSTHTLRADADGLHTGQCTYGDMNLHLGLITSIAGQQTFPPAYSISPEDKLCYPFLCDSISSSLYLFGASLRYAYMLPMYFAFLQVMAGFYFLAYTWLKKAAKACLAWYFFFYNGGLGFVYFIDWSREQPYRFQDIFTAYYETPTNLIDNNIRWVNVMVDMLLPQRATLFGYAVLFTCIWLLWRCVFQKEQDLFPITGLLTAALPMIHTHSFLAMLLISGTWLLASLWKEAPIKRNIKYPGKILFLAFFTFMLVLQQGNGQAGALDAPRFLYLCLAGLGILLLCGLTLLCRHIKRNGFQQLLSTWGIYFAVLFLLSLPQLLFWTFHQTANTGFLTGHFNWGNQGDHYLWFYVKNWGVILLLLVPAILYSKGKNLAALSSGFLIWFVVELICFSPNSYDNNKLLYVSYLFFCCISADYGYRLFHKIRALQGVRLWAIAFLFFSGISAVLSLGRELLSDYTLYSSAQIHAALYVEENTAANATFLTNDRHANEISSLTGRNIVNGPSIFLWPHGIYDQERVDDVTSMYESPALSLQLFEKYHVDYVVISSWEQNSYHVDEAAFAQMFPCVFAEDEIKIYQIFYRQHS